MLIAGMDGYKQGWIAAMDDGTSLRVEAFPDFEAIVHFPHGSIVVVDIPIGLVDQGSRAADTAARKLLRQRACCVFNSPIRPVLKCQGYEEAHTTLRDLGEKGCSRQSWGILPKIRYVDDFLRKNPNLRARIHEGHPEVSFAAMNSRSALRASKHSPEGETLRLNLLQQVFGGAVERGLKEYPRAREDVIDAFAMLWTARRVANGSHQRLPEEGGQIDSMGLKAEIVY